MIRAALFSLLIGFNCLAYEYQISICSIFRNEALFLKEWIEFHRLIGVEHFYLYNHNSTDHYVEVLTPYVEEGVVELIDWIEEPKNREHWHMIQAHAYRDGAIRAQNKTKWITFLDLDEMIFPVEDHTLLPFLKKYEGIGAVCINWQNFGTSNVKKLDPEKLMIEQLIYRAHRKFYFNEYVKSIVEADYLNLDESVKPAHNKIFWRCHTFPLKPGYKTVNANYKRVSGMVDNSIPVDKIRIHHYSFRDWENFKKKLNRPNNNAERRRLTREREKSSNAVLDESILIYADALREAVFGSVE